MFSRAFSIARLRPAGPIKAAAVAMVVSAGTMATIPAAAAPSVDGDNQPITSAGVLSTRVTRGRNWRLGVRLNALSDSNYRRRPEGLEESALRLTPVVDAGVGLPVGRQQLFVGGSIGRDYFINKPLRNRNRWQLGGGVAWRLGSRCSGIIGAETRRRLVQLDDQSEFTDNVQTSNDIGASANCQTATGLGFGGSVRHDDTSNDTPNRMVFDSRSTTYSPSISYGNRSLGQFSLGATVSNISFTNRPVPTPAGFVEDGLRSLNGRAGYSRTLGSRLQLTAGLSYLRTTPKPGTVLAIDPNGQVVVVPREPFSGTGYDFSLAYQPSTRLSVVVAGDRGVSASRNVGALFTIRQGVSADINYKVGPSIDVGAGVSRRTNEYKGSFVSAAEPQPRISDQFERVYAQIDYSPVSLYSIGVEVAHQRRKSNPSTFNFASTTALLRLRVSLGRG